ncbi:MAG: 2-oxoacid:ferredoxin oxidoreductase subunit beta [Candidatus Eisenbacteria bacterium]|uniref:2-oxoacid:ferredoxin oxidoreductase subunit beta n=1 Tax=Eiseniibacteriota bacterium TaxID=2212470 RepID=A0A7Y2EAS1_UNCEI|nr:2-oxoacid:ferredoxin oxidoreductase subunit beta [Candidatus Eisenbacteria bacterium]
MSTVKDDSGLTRKDFETDQEVRWCPGCGDYAILNAVQSVFPQLGVPKEKFVVVSGIGCSSRFPYYMNTFGFHTIHGRAPAIATGVKVANPELKVWVVTGDGDALSIGGNHLIHAMRKNIGLKILMFNNRIYGLTKGQYSPTSEVGKRTKSTPYGSVDAPLNPLSLVLGAEATFVARSVDVYKQHLQDTLKQAASHNGTAFVEIYQNCNIFNDKAFESFTERKVREEMNITLTPGEPVRFGKDGAKGLRWDGRQFEIVDATQTKDLYVHDPTDPDPTMAFALSRLSQTEFPVPIGVFRSVKRQSLEQGIWSQLHQVQESQGDGDLQKMLHSGDTWEVK